MYKLFNGLSRRFLANFWISSKIMVKIVAFLTTDFRGLLSDLQQRTWCQKLLYVLGYTDWGRNI